MAPSKKNGTSIRTGDPRRLAITDRMKDLGRCSRATNLVEHIERKVFIGHLLGSPLPEMKSRTYRDFGYVSIDVDTLGLVGFYASLTDSRADDSPTLDIEVHMDRMMHLASPELTDKERRAQWDAWFPEASKAIKRVTFKVDDARTPASDVGEHRRAMGYHYRNKRGEVVCPCGSVTGPNLNGNPPPFDLCAACRELPWHRHAGANVNYASGFAADVAKPAFKGLVGMVMFCGLASCRAILDCRQAVCTDHIDSPILCAKCWDKPIGQAVHTKFPGEVWDGRKL